MLWRRERQRERESPIGAVKWNAAHDWLSCRGVTCGWCKRDTMSLPSSLWSDRSSRPSVLWRSSLKPRQAQISWLATLEKISRSNAWHTSPGSCKNKLVVGHACRAILSNVYWSLLRYGSLYLLKGLSLLIKNSSMYSSESVRYYQLFMNGTWLLPLWKKAQREVRQH